MSQKLRNGEGKDLALQPGESLLVAAKSGSYNVTIVDGVGVPSVIATNAAGGSYGPYPTGAVLRLSVSRISEIDFSFGVSPSIASDSFVTSMTDPITGWVTFFSGDAVLCVTASYDVNTEYLSPNQHGGLYGAVYRVYVFYGDHLGAGNANTIAYGPGITIADLIDYSLLSRDDSGVLWRPVPFVDYGSANMNIQVVFGPASFEVRYGISADSGRVRGWVDYTK